MPQLSSHELEKTSARGIVWNEIDSIFLDMDGTLLDLRFDNYFWAEYIPHYYAKVQGLELHEAKKRISALRPGQPGTLDWYSLDLWSEVLDMQLGLLQEEMAHLIRVHDGVLQVLEDMRKMKKRLVLVTDAHPAVLRLKLEHTELEAYFDAIFSAHEIGVSKENPGFWCSLAEKESFNPARTLLVDDTPAILDAAQQHGIFCLRQVLKPDSEQPAQQAGAFPAVQAFTELAPNSIPISLYSK
ncbi:MAG: GMP/IMP nucleotidase [Sedimenticola sp.]